MRVSLRRFKVSTGRSPVEALRDLVADPDRPNLAGSQRNLTRSMGWTYMLDPMVSRANDLNVKHVNALFHDTMTIMDAIEEKASKLLVEYTKKRIIDKIKNKEAKGVLQDKITTLLTKDENRRAAMDTSASVAFAPCVVLDPYMLMLRMMSRAADPNIGRLSYTVNVLIGALNFWHPASHANNSIVLQALCNVVDYPKTGASIPAVYLSTANNSTSTLYLTAHSLWDCPNPVLNPQNEEIFDCLVLSLTLASIFGIESLDIDFSDEHKRLLKKLRDDHQKKLKAYQKDNKDDDPSMVLQRLYKNVGVFLDQNRHVLEEISTIPKGEGERKKANGAFAGSAAGTHTVESLQAQIQSRSSTLTGPSSPPKESKRRVGKSGSQQAADHMPPSPDEKDAVVKLVGKSDQLLSLVVTVVSAKTTKGKFTKKELEAPKIREIMNSLAMFAPKSKFPNSDAKVIAKALLDVKDLRNSIAQVPWISNGECEQLQKTGFETLVVNKDLVTSKEYRNLLKDIAAIS